MRPSDGEGRQGGEGEGAPTAKAARLARMANQIAAFFRSYPEEEAVAGVQDHIVAFWAPRMRADLDAVLDEPRLGLDPLVVSAFRRMARADSPIQRETAGPETVGQLGSDAG